MREISKQSISCNKKMEKINDLRLYSFYMYFMVNLNVFLHCDKSEFTVEKISRKKLKEAVRDVLHAIYTVFSCSMPLTI